MTDAAPAAKRERNRGRSVRPRFPLLVIAMLLASACSRDAARVGTIRITERDLAQRAKVSEIRFPGSGKRHVALAQLVKGNLAFSLLGLRGVPTDEAAIEAEARRIDANTRAPELLKKIKDVYGADRRGYLDTFVRVAYAERVLYNEVFLKDPSIHADPRKKADALLAAARKTPSALETSAKEMGLEAVTLTVSRGDGIGRAIEREQAARMIAALSGVRPGDPAPAALEWPESFQVIRLLRKEGTSYRIASVHVPKRGYDDWFWETASKIPVRIDDGELKAALLKEVSWGARLAITP